MVERRANASLYAAPRDTRIMSRRVESISSQRLAAPRVAFALPFSLDTTRYFVSRLFTVSPEGNRIVVVRTDDRRPAFIDTLQVTRNFHAAVKAALTRWSRQ